MSKEQYYHSAGWVASYVRCPFWKGSDRRMIVCEGLNKGEKLQRIIPVARKSEEMAVFCCGKYEDCRVYKMLLAGYE